MQQNSQIHCHHSNDSDQANYFMNTPSNTFTSTRTTRDSGGAVIDGHSQSNVYTVKQIGTCRPTPHEVYSVIDNVFSASERVKN